MRKRTIRQRNEDRRRREYTEATIREESRREEKRRQVKMKEEKIREDKRTQEKRKSEKRASRVFPTGPQVHRQELFPLLSPLLGASCLFSFLFSLALLLWVLCLVFGSLALVTACVSLGGRVCIGQLQ